MMNYCHFRFIHFVMSPVKIQKGIFVRHLLRDFLIKQGWIILFPQRRVFFFEPLQDGFHYRFTKEL